MNAFVYKKKHTQTLLEMHPKFKLNEDPDKEPFLTGNQRYRWDDRRPCVWAVFDWLGHHVRPWTHFSLRQTKCGLHSIDFCICESMDIVCGGAYVIYVTTAAKIVTVVAFKRRKARANRTEMANHSGRTWWQSRNKQFVASMRLQATWMEAMKSTIYIHVVGLQLMMANIEHLV